MNSVTYTKSFLFSVGSALFAVGIWLASVYRLHAVWLEIGAAAAVGCLAISLLARFRHAAFAAFCAIVLISGCSRMQAAEEPNQFEGMFGVKQKVEGLIVEDVDVRSDKQLLTVQPHGYTQHILVTTTKVQMFKYGDRVVVEGKFKEPENFSGFDYQGYLQRFGIYATVQYPKVLILKSGLGNPVTQNLLRLRDWFVRRVSQTLPSPQRELLLGILIGAKKSLPPNITEDFSLTGTSHIVAISGFNISIIIVALGYCARYVGRRTVFWSSLVFLFAFAILTGGSASVVRATVMGLLLLIAQNIGRQYRVIPAMLFAAAMMLVLNPKILYYDIGFQLSFAATFGIVLFMPVFETLTESWPSVGQVKGIFLATMSAIVATLPLILLYFGTLSVVAPLANIAVLWIIPAAMLFGFLSVIPFFGAGFGYIANSILAYVLWVIHFFAHVPFSSVAVSVSPLVAGLLYLVLAGVYVILKRIVGAKQRQVESVYSLW